MKTLLLLWLALSGPQGFQQAVLVLSGASCAEELSEDEMARYQSLAAHPVDLNAAGRSRLLATGLLSPYQVASLLDYRERSGAVLSWTELGLVDGFGAELAAALQEFCTLGAGRAAPGARPDRRVRQSLTLRAGARGGLAEAVSSAPGASSPGGGLLRFDAPAAVGGVKYELATGERAALYWSTRTTYSEPRLTAGTFSAAWYGRRALGQLIVGNFGARFGQGLVQWSGFALSGYNSLGAFRRNGTGFSPTGSWSPSLFGVASDWHFGPWRLSVAYSLGASVTEVISRIGSLASSDHLSIASISPSLSPTILFTKSSLTSSVSLMPAGGLGSALDPVLLLSANESIPSPGRGLAAFFLQGQPIVNLTRTWRRATAGLTATSQAASLEARAALPGWSLFGEFALRYPRSLQSLLTDSPAVSSISAGSSSPLSYSATGAGSPISSLVSGASSSIPSAASGANFWDRWPVRAVAGAIWVPAYGHRAGIVVRWLGVGKDYSGVAAGYEGPALSATADASVRPDTRASQLKSVLQWRPTLSLSAPDSLSRTRRLTFVSATLSDDTSATSPLTLQPLLRAQLRWRPTDANETPFPFAAAGVRLDLRGMLTATFDPWILAGRYDAVLGRGFAWNWYLEAGWKTEPFAVYARGGLFKVDDWDDRIYVYERDAPGSFTVPARYGRGWDAALYAAWRPARRHSFWLRLETVRYPAPWALSPKDGRLELRLQYRYQSR